MNRIFGLILMVFLSACGGLKDVTKFKKEDIVFSLKKGSCYGKCSVYNLDVYKNGYVVYEGIMNVEKYGIYARKLSKQELISLKSNFDQDGFYGFDDNYPVRNPDLPTITMTYTKEKESKTITGSLDRPNKVLAMQRLLENLIKSSKFKLVKQYEAKTSQEEVTEEVKVVEEYFDNQIIIELNANVFMAQWLRKYSKYDVQLVNKVSPDLNYWVITFNKQKIASDQFMQVIKSDSDVKMAEYNKRVQNRGK